MAMGQSERTPEKIMKNQTLKMVASEAGGLQVAPQQISPEVVVVKGCQEKKENARCSIE